MPKGTDGSFKELLFRGPSAPESMSWPDKTTLIVKLENAASLDIVARSHFNCRNQKSFTAKIAPVTDHELVLTPADFKSVDGKSPEDFSFVETFGLSGTSLSGKKLLIKYLGWGNHR